MTLMLQKGMLVYEIFAFIGNKNMAMLISVGVAIVTLAKYIPGSTNQIMMRRPKKPD
jgi:H+/gluconate symporter-like permease